MALVRRDEDRKAKQAAYLIALLVHFILGVIFWKTGGVEKVKSYVMEMIEAETKAPPPPPKPAVNKIALQRPAAQQVKFTVDTKVPVDNKLSFNFKVMSSFDADVPSQDFTGMAQNYSVKTFSLDRSQVANVTADILKAVGVVDFMDEGKKVTVSGVGKRMRARLNLCVASTPGSTIIGRPGRALGGGITDTTLLKTKVKWDYLFRKFNSIERARAWLKENTQIQVTENTLTMNFENTFADWVQSIRKKGALATDSASGYHETVALRTLEHAIEKLETDPISGRRAFVTGVRGAAYGYIARKYEIPDPELLPSDVLMKKIEERFILREWRKRGLSTLIANAGRLNADQPGSQLTESLRPFYVFFRSAEALENPLLIFANAIGLEKLADENLDILRTYVQNGGFIWIDDTGIATENINGQDQVARAFIHNLMSFDERGDLSDKEQESFANLSREDKAVQGFDLGAPFPDFAHPEVYIPLVLPQDSPTEIRIFNRLGLPVRQFLWTKEKPMKAGSYLRKEVALVWACDNNDGEPVESGNYFLQMQAGLFQKTKVVRVGKLRMLDEKHPLMGVVHTFRNVPVCTIDNGSRFWKTRLYGNAAFGYYLKGRMTILYTEGSGLVAGLGDLSNTVAKEMASKFLNNVIAFSLSDEDGVAVRP